MATKTAAKKVATKGNKAPAKEGKTTKEKVGVSYLADRLGLDPFTVRVKLRDAGVEKLGRAYEFSVAEADKLVKQFSKGKEE